MRATDERIRGKICRGSSWAQSVSAAAVCAALSGPGGGRGGGGSAVIGQNVGNGAVGGGSLGGRMGCLWDVPSYGAVRPSVRPLCLAMGCVPCYGAVPSPWGSAPRSPTHHSILHRAILRTTAAPPAPPIPCTSPPASYHPQHPIDPLSSPRSPHHPIPPSPPPQTPIPNPSRTQGAELPAHWRGGVSNRDWAWLSLKEGVVKAVGGVVIVIVGVV